MHPADAATDSFDRDLVLGLASFEQGGLYEIDAALRRIDDGTYGLCELTGRPIPWKRLEAVPWTRFSVEAERRVEGNDRPHIGALGTVQPLEKQRVRKSRRKPNRRAARRLLFSRPVYFQSEYSDRRYEDCTSARSEKLVRNKIG
jgi:RNA polymerase-binding transcription factor DksA